MYYSYSFVEESIGLTVGGVAEKHPFITLGIELPSVFTIIEDVASTSKDMKVLDSRLSSFPDLIRSHHSAWPQVHLVDDVASGVHSFSPNPMRNTHRIQHNSRHFFDSPLLPFNNTIFLRCLRS